MRFTVNLGRIKSADEIDARFKDYDCRPLGTNSRRLADIAPMYGFDKWWSITCDADMAEMEDDILDLIQNTAFPWFRNVD